MNVFRLGDEADFIVAFHFVIAQYIFERPQLLAVNDQQFVFVELYFLRHVGIQHGNSRAAVVHQQVLVIPEDAFQNGHVDMLAVEVGMALVAMLVARFEDDVDGETERIEQIHESLKHILGDTEAIKPERCCGFLVAYNRDGPFAWERPESKRAARRRSA